MLQFIRGRSVTDEVCLTVSQRVTLVYSILVFVDNKVEITPPSTNEQLTTDSVLRIQAI